LENTAKLKQLLSKVVRFAKVSVIADLVLLSEQQYKGFWKSTYGYTEEEAQKGWDSCKESGCEQEWENGELKMYTRLPKIVRGERGLGWVCSSGFAATGRLSKLHTGSGGGEACIN
jgi:hypothetical protein